MKVQAVHLCLLARVVWGSDACGSESDVTASSASDSHFTHARAPQPAWAAQGARLWHADTLRGACARRHSKCASLPEAATYNAALLRFASKCVLRSSSAEGHAAALLAGTDAACVAFQELPGAVRGGLVREADVDAAARRYLAARRARVPPRRFWASRPWDHVVSRACAVSRPSWSGVPSGRCLMRTSAADLACALCERDGMQGVACTGCRYKVKGK